MALGKATGNQKLLRSHRCSESRDTSHYYVLLAVNFDAYALTALIRSQQNNMQKKETMKSENVLCFENPFILNRSCDI